MPLPMTMSPFGLAAALYGNVSMPLSGPTGSEMFPESEEAKTIPIPLMLPHAKPGVQEGFYIFDEEIPCPDGLCIFFGQKHFHCSQPRCYYVTNRSDILIMHSKDFHDNIDIMEGFVFFDRSVDCRMPGCPSNKLNRHFHCTRLGCNYTFVRYSTMNSHEEMHKNENEAKAQNENNGEEPHAGKASSATASQASSHSDDDGDSVKSALNANCVTSNSNSNIKPQVIKAAGTYYPLSSLKQRQSHTQPPAASVSLVLI